MQPPKDNTKVYAAVGSAVTLPCVFASGLKPFGSEWEKLKTGSTLKPALGHLPPSFSLSSQSYQIPWDKSARVEEVGYMDEGSYRCSGIIGRQQVTRTMQLVVAKSKFIMFQFMVAWKSIKCLFLALNIFFSCLLPVDSSKTKAAVTLTCQLTDASDVTDYEWVRVTYDINGTQSVGPTQKGKTISISRESDESGEWACLFYGKEGILGNITYHVPLMGKFSSLDIFYINLVTNNVTNKCCQNMSSYQWQKQFMYMQNMPSSDWFCVVFFATAGLTGQKSKGLSHNTTAVVGLSILLGVLLLILIQMFKNHQRVRICSSWHYK